MTLGSDFSGVDDLDFALTYLEGEQSEQLAFMQAIQRRLTSPRGALWYDPSYGLALRTLLADNVSVGVAQGVIAAEIRKDERVANAEVTITIDTLGKWKIDMFVTALTGDSLELTFKIDSSKIEVIASAIS